MIDLTSLLGNVAFPVIVASWFMFRVEKKLDEVTSALMILAQKTR